ncbi:hypothetical protein A71_175 [Escherichia phage A7_1]|nr:hypothetical protein A71_175 [Escherichia phage A7_1]
MFDRVRYSLPVLLRTATCPHADQTISSTCFQVLCTSDRLVLLYSIQESSSCLSIVVAPSSQPLCNLSYGISVYPKMLCNFFLLKRGINNHFVNLLLKIISISIWISSTVGPTMIDIFFRGCPFQINIVVVLPVAIFMINNRKVMRVINVVFSHQLVNKSTCNLTIFT